MGINRHRDKNKYRVSKALKFLFVFAQQFTEETQNYNIIMKKDKVIPKSRLVAKKKNRRR